MKRTRCLAALIAAFVPAVGALSCSAKTGELVVVIQTDMDVPKDINSVRIEVNSGGIPWLAQNYERIDENEGFRLPATLGITTEGDSSRPVTIRIIAFRGSASRTRVASTSGSSEPASPSAS